MSTNAPRDSAGSRETGGGRGWRSGADRLVVPVALVVWWVSSFFLLGDLGKYSDDWFFSGRDPATGETVPFRSPIKFGFWRPLHKLLVPGLQQRFWYGDAWNHLVGAIAHGGAGVLLHWLLRRLGSSVLVAGAVSLLFIANPAVYEVVFWSSALSTGVATSCFLVLCHLVVSCATSPKRRSLWLLAAVAFAIPCFNEQPAAGVLALPLLYVAARPGGRVARADYGRAILVGAATTTAVGLYLGLYLSTARRGRGLIGSWTHAGDVAARIGELAGPVFRQVFDPPRARAAMGLGLETIAENAVLLIPPVALGFGAWLLLRKLRPMSSRARPMMRGGWLLAFAAVLFVADWFPVFLVARTPVSSRMVYAPSAALALGLAALLQLAVQKISERRRAFAELVFAAVASVVVVAGTFGLVGYQALFERRARTDESLARELREAIPDPDEGSLFLILGDQRALIDTGVRRFDRALPGAFDLPQSATPFVRWAYRRLDVAASRPVAGRLEYVRRLTEDGVEMVLPDQGFDLAYERVEEGGVRVPWDRVIPIRVDADGVVKLSGRLGSGRGTTAYRVPQVERLGIGRRSDVGLQRSGKS